jgi:D-3-phosphoglycerate dehydrogenase
MEGDLLRYAGTFDGTLCGDDRYTRRVLEACLPRLGHREMGRGHRLDRSVSLLGVRLFRTPNAFTVVADSVMGYVLAFARRLPGWIVAEIGQMGKLPGRALSSAR